MLYTQIIEYVSGFKVVRAIDQHVWEAVSLVEEQVLGIVGTEVCDNRVDVDLGVDDPKPLSGSDCLWTARTSVRVGIERLTVEIGDIDEIPIDDRELSYSRAGQEICAGAP